jgi:hypothetical protein
VTLRAAGLLVLLVAAGCAATAEPERAPEPFHPKPGEPLPELPEEDGVALMAGLDLRIEADVVRIQVPDRLSGEIRLDPRSDSPPWTFRLRDVVVVVREQFPRVDTGGEDFWISAEGIVKTVRKSEGLTLREGPFQTLLLRNGTLMRR